MIFVERMQKLEELATQHGVEERKIIWDSLAYNVFLAGLSVESCRVSTSTNVLLV